jgi:hypothetical protein
VVSAAPEVNGRRDTPFSYDQAAAGGALAILKKSHDL